MLSGAHRLLRRQSIEVLSIEYAVGWHPHFHHARPLTSAERAEVRTPLRRLVSRLSAYGYDTYLLHALSNTDGMKHFLRHRRLKSPRHAGWCRGGRACRAGWRR